MDANIVGNVHNELLLFNFYHKNRKYLVVRMLSINVHL